MSTHFRNIGRWLKNKIVVSYKQSKFHMALFNHIPWLRMRLQHNVMNVSHSYLSKCKIKVGGANNSVIIGTNCHLHNCSFFIYGSNNTITIEDNVVAENVCFWLEDNNNNLVVGSNTTFHGRCHLAAIEGTTIKIGTDCMFSSDIVVRTGDSHTITDLSGQRINASKDVTIGNHTWVGNKVTMNKGVVLPDHSVVGACSVVTKPFDTNNVVIAGNPAKIIKENIDWLRERI